MVRRSSFSLIEILISFFLLAILMGTFSFGYFHLTRMNTTIEKKLAMAEELQGLNQRLAHIFARITRFISVGNDPFDCIFCFDRGVSKNPKLGGEVLARMYVDPYNQTLCLMLWPSYYKWGIMEGPKELLILMDDIESAAISLYKSELEKAIVEIEKVGKPYPKKGWQNEWHPAYQELPSLVKLDLKRSLCCTSHYYPLNFEPIRCLKE